MPDGRRCPRARPPLSEPKLPTDAEHAPGLGHVIADCLSRVFASGIEATVSRAVRYAFAEAEISEAPTRDPSWYKATPSPPTATRDDQGLCGLVSPGAEHTSLI